LAAAHQIDGANIQPGEAGHGELVASKARSFDTNRKTPLHAGLFAYAVVSS
jgi:hypothetical protein